MTSQVQGTHQGHKSRDAEGLVISWCKDGNGPGKAVRKAQAVLDVRIRDYESWAKRVGPANVASRRRPGSLHTPR